MPTAEEILRRHHEALSQLSRSEVWRAGDLQSALRLLMRVAAEVLEVERVGVWLFVDGRSAIEAATTYHRSEQRFDGAARVEAAACPGYFEALGSERAIPAHDAVSDPRTRELAEAYLLPQGVGALLDAPIFTGGESVGVVCHEHVGGPRRWTTAEQLFAGSIADYVALAMNAAEARRAREQAEAQRAHLELALEVAEMATWWWNIPEGTSHWSDRMGPMLGRPKGWTPSSQEAFEASIHPEDRAQLAEAVRTVLEEQGRTFYAQYRAVDPEGQIRWLESHGRVERGPGGEPLRMFGAIIDITGRKALEGQLVQAQKMEAVGQLAGGIAHDFNNLLTVISGAAEMAQADAEAGSQLRQDMDDVLTASERARRLTQQLLVLGRRQPGDPQPVDVNALLEDVHSLLRRLLGADIEMVTELSDGPLVTRVDPVQLEQVLVNLAVNARDAMVGGGKLTVRTSLESVEGRAHVVIHVEDTGHGMDEETARRAFEPFFTTKPRGRGTGLGLATCYGIVEQAGGKMRIESEVGRGTVVSVVMPREDAPSSSHDIVSPPRPAQVGGTERLLLVEDEPLVRRRAARALRELGYVVTTCANAAEADAVLETAEPVDLLVSDVVMPGESGASLARRLLEAGRVQAALLISGYAFDEVDPELPLAVHFLAKPFRMDELAGRVRAILDARRAPREAS